MQKKFYYYRDELKRPVVTICLLKNGDKLSRGMSICSDEDIPCKKVGRKIAEQRAKWAMKKENSNCNVQSERGLDIMYPVMPYQTFFLLEFKAQYMPELTTFEKKLFKEEETA